MKICMCVFVDDCLCAEPGCVTLLPRERNPHTQYCDAHRRRAGVYIKRASKFGWVRHRRTTATTAMSSSSNFAISNRRKSLDEYDGDRSSL